jgi:hypothetical protein
MKYIPQIDDVITIINEDKTTTKLFVTKQLDEHNCVTITHQDPSNIHVVLVCRNSINIVYNVMIIDKLFNVYDIKRNNEFLVNNHDVFIYVKES